MIPIKRVKNKIIYKRLLLLIVKNDYHYDLSRVVSNRMIYSQTIPTQDRLERSRRGLGALRRA